MLEMKDETVKAPRSKDPCTLFKINYCLFKTILSLSQGRKIINLCVTSVEAKIV